MYCVDFLFASLGTVALKEALLFKERIPCKRANSFLTYETICSSFSSAGKFCLAVRLGQLTRGV